MKLYRLLPVAGAVGFSVFFSSSASAVDQVVPASGAVTPPAINSSVSVVPLSISPAAEYASWDDIKQFTYEQRAEFSAGLRRLEAKLDKQIAGLNAKRATLKNDTKEWDFAMRALADARAYLRSLSSEVNNTSPELWNDQKEKVQRAWQTALEAADRVKATTTQS